MMNSTDDLHYSVIRGYLDSCERLLLVANTVTPAQYSASWKNHNGIGPHMRHAYEHLIALMDGCAEGVVRYDARERNTALETEPTTFVEAMDDVVAWAQQLVPAMLDDPLVVCQIPRVDAPETRSSSTLRRELLFLTSHTIHHLAIVAMLAELQGINLPPDLGVAYSTTTHEHELRGEAPASAATTS
jgi:hypothetical protein